MKLWLITFSLNGRESKSLRLTLLPTVTHKRHSVRVKLIFSAGELSLKVPDCFPGHLAEGVQHHLKKDKLNHEALGWLIGRIGRIPAGLSWCLDHKDRFSLFVFHFLVPVSTLQRQLFCFIFIRWAVERARVF